jgi:hypothetical protein
MKKIRRFASRTTLSVLALALLLSGCGGGTASPQSGQVNTDDPSALATAIAAEVEAASGTTGTSGSQSKGLDLSTIDPCTLLTEEDVAAIMGPVNVKPTFTDIPGAVSKDCVFVNRDNMTDPMLSVMLSPLDRWEYEKLSLQVDGTPSNVSGVGDEAVTADAVAWQRLLVLVKDRAFIQVRIVPKDVEMAKKIAEKVIENLPSQ